MKYSSLKVEIADSPYKWSQGLMFRKNLEEDSGMIFKFRQPQKLKFWGVNTYIPLDIAFVTPHGKISQISNIKPLDDTAVVSDEQCIMAIEANMGYFKDKKISIGDKVNFKNLTENIGIVNFEKSQVKIAQQMIDWDDEIGAIPADVKDLLEDTHDLEESTYDSAQEDTPPQYEETIEEEPIDFDQTVQPEPIPDVPTDEDYPDFNTTEEALKWALANNEVIRIWYQTLRGRDVERDIEPHEFYVARTTGNNIVITYDRTVNDIRAFIVGNILYYSFVGSNFEKKFNTPPKSEEITEDQRKSDVKIRKR